MSLETTIVKTNKTYTWENDRQRSLGQDGDKPVTLDDDCQKTFSVDKYSQKPLSLDCND